MRVLSSLSSLSSRTRIAAAAGLVLVALLSVVAVVFVHQRQSTAQASGPMGVCGGPQGKTIITLVPPGVTLPVKIPAGEPQIVATVNGDPLSAEALELQVAATLANNRQALQTAQQTMPGGLPPNIQAQAHEMPNQVRHDALTRMIQECLLLQEGKRLGLTASLAAARAFAQQQLHLIESWPASNTARATFEDYLRANHLSVQTYATDPRIVQGYRDSLTMAAVRQHIEKGLPADVSPQAGIAAYLQHLWQTSQVHVFLPARLGW